MLAMQTKKRNQKKKVKIHFRLRWWWVALLLLILWVSYRFDYTVYDSQQLIPISCTYQKIDVTGGYRGYVHFIIDSSQRAYRIDMDNIRPLRDNLKPGDVLNLLIEPPRSEYYPYDRTIARLETNGYVYYSQDEYTAYKQDMVQQHHIIDLVIKCFLGVSLVGMFLCQNQQLWRKKRKKKKKKKPPTKNGAA